MDDIDINKWYELHRDFDSYTEKLKRDIINKIIDRYTELVGGITEIIELSEEGEEGSLLMPFSIIVCPYYESEAYHIDELRVSPWRFNPDDEYKFSLIFLTDKKKDGQRVFAECQVSAYNMCMEDLIGVYGSLKKMGFFDDAKKTDFIAA